jgi:uncharacterized RDD family membrane protein YckC
MSSDAFIATTPDEGEPAPGSALEPAGFWIRAAARLIDWCVLAMVGVLVSFVAGIAAAAISMATGRSMNALIEGLGKTTFIGWIGSAVASVAYYTLFEGVAGTTVGKRLIGLHVISMDLSPVRFGQALKRSVAFLVDALFFGAIGAGEMSGSPEKQRIGDRWANTRVVRRRTLPPEGRPPKLLFFAALVSAVDVAFLITAVTKVLEYFWLTRGAR